MLTYNRLAAPSRGEAGVEGAGAGPAAGDPGTEALVRIGERLAAPARRKVVKRRPEGWTRLRRAFQVAFLLLNAWIGVDFWLFVRHHETGGVSPAVPRPPGIEGWLPIAALMNLKAWILTGSLPRLFPAGVLLLVAFFAIAFLFRKAFCSWLCPIGTLSEALWRLGQRVLGRSLALPRWLDFGLRGVKYLLLGFFVWAVARMPLEGIQQFLASPYGVIADVKMLNFFRHTGTAGAIVLGLLVALSIPIQNFWCRYLCPYGGLLGLLAMLSPVRIRRDAVACTDCGKCAKVCPSRLPVDVKRSIASPECTGCADCVAACPVAGALDLSAARRRPIPAWAFAAGVAAVFLGVVLAGRVTGHWHTEIPAAVYRELIPRQLEFDHP